MVGVVMSSRSHSWLGCSYGEFGNGMAKLVQRTHGKDALNRIVSLFAVGTWVVHTLMLCSRGGTALARARGCMSVAGPRVLTELGCGVVVQTVPSRQWWTWRACSRCWQ